MTTHAGQSDALPHACLPWHTNPELSLHGTVLVYGKDGYLVADCGRIPVRATQTMQANAAFIVRACNAHDALVNALISIAELQDSNDYSHVKAQMTSAMAFKALALVRGGK